MIKVGVIGAGKWGRNHVRVYSGIQNCELAGIADINPATESLASEFNTKFYSDYKEMLGDVDAVSIVVPTDLHYEIVKECIEAGKHVLVEKPLTKTSERSAELRKLAEEKGVYLTVGYLFRFNAAVQELKKRLAEIGDIQYITARYMHSNKPPRKDMGVVFNFGVHLIDMLSFVLEKEPQKLFCKSKRFLSQDREDAAIATLDYGNFMAELEMSWLHPLKKRDLWVIGSKKKIYVDLLEQIMTIYPIQVDYAGNKIEPEQTIEIHKNEPLKDELTAFVTSVESKDFSANTTYNTTKLCELCLKSAEQGIEVSNE
jgi:UDP-N-acetylglucosamine 3-dehydrogenase|tara:strand:- start:760 stop:1701 length:942 start_codon:yes stop_codon:yes gene_type:complete